MTESLTLDHGLWQLIRDLTGVAISLDDSTDEAVWLCEAPIDDDGDQDTIGLYAVVETAEFHLSVRLSTRAAGDDHSLTSVPISRRHAMLHAGSRPTPSRRLSSLCHLLSHESTTRRLQLRCGHDPTDRRLEP